MITHARQPSAFLAALISERRVRQGQSHDDRSPVLDSGTGPYVPGRPAVSENSNRDVGRGGARVSFRR